MCLCCQIYVAMKIVHNNVLLSFCYSHCGVQLFAIPWTAAHQASLSFTISWTLLNSYQLSWWHHPTSVIPFPPAFNLPQLRVFSSESALHIRWPKCWNFSFSISPSNEYSESISFRIDWFDLLIYDYPFSLCNICAAVTSLIPNFCLWLSLSSSFFPFLVGLEVYQF